jgi:hypothetical protein
LELRLELRLELELASQVTLHIEVDMFVFRLVVFLGMVCGSAGQLVDARTFTDEKGREIEAGIVRVQGDKVELELDKNGKTYKVPVGKLSEADREFIKEWQESKKSAEGDEAKARSQGGQTSRSGRGGGAAALMEQYDLKENYEADWPKLVSVDIGIDVQVVSEDEGEGKFVYQSPNYEFVCDVALSKNVVKKFAVMFEATREYCRLLPISTMKAHIPGEQFRHRILLFEAQETYMKNGGMPGSAGVFISRGGNGVVMAPLTSLGVIKGKGGYRFDYDGSNKTLPHELAHQLTDVEYFSSGGRGWFSEGLAEYIAVTPYRSGKFMVKTNLSEIKEYVTAYGEKGRGGRALGEKIDAPDLKEFMLQSYQDFIANGNFNYGMGLLLTYYFFQMEEDRTNIVAFMKALKAGKRGQDAIDRLLNGRSYDELEQQVAKAWKSRGVRITFR